MSSEIPDDHPIRQVWLDNRKGRTLDGLIEMAQAGDKPAIRSLFGMFVLKVQNRRTPDPAVMEYFASCFLRIIADKGKGESADVVFGLTKKGRRGRPVANSQERFLHAMIAHEVGTLIAAGSSREEAILEVSKLRKKGEKSVGKYYDQYRVPENI